MPTRQVREMARACLPPCMLQGLPCCAPEAAAAQSIVLPRSLRQPASDSCALHLQGGPLCSACHAGLLHLCRTLQTYQNGVNNSLLGV